MVIEDSKVGATGALASGASVIGHVVVDSVGGTVAVSAAALPLPAGAATAAKQPAPGTAGTASADVACGAAPVAPAS